MRFVKDSEIHRRADGELAKCSTKFRHLKPLRRDKHEIGIPLSNFTQKGFGLPLPCCLSREPNCSINTVGLKTSDLIFDKRNDRVDNQRSSWQTKPCQLVDEALAAVAKHSSRDQR